jgi:streptogramin lyase
MSLHGVGDGTLVLGFAQNPDPTPSPLPKEVKQVLVRYNTRGSPLESLGWFFYGEYFVQATSSGPAYWDRAFGRRGFVQLKNGRVYFLDVDDGFVRVAPIPGPGLVEVHHWQPGVRRITTGMIDEYKRISLKSVPAKNVPAANARLEAMPYPATLPPYRALIVDDRDRIWLQEYSTGVTATANWVVLDPRTKAAQRTTMPSRFTPYVITADEAIGIWKTEDDIEVVRLYRLLN